MKSFFWQDSGTLCMDKGEIGKCPRICIYMSDFCVECVLPLLFLLSLIGALTCQKDLWFPVLVTPSFKAFPVISLLCRSYCLGLSVFFGIIRGTFSLKQDDCVIFSLFVSVTPLFVLTAMSLCVCVMLFCYVKSWSSN